MTPNLSNDFKEFLMLLDEGEIVLKSIDNETFLEWCIDKLPLNHKRNFIKKMADLEKEPTLKTLRKWIEKLVIYQDKCIDRGIPLSKEIPTDSKAMKKTFATQETSYSNPKSQNSTNKYCKFCKVDGHVIRGCNKFIITNLYQI